jgi:hypothetical protein
MSSRRPAKAIVAEVRGFALGGGFEMALNLQFGDGEFNFVKTRAEHGTKQALELCKDHFEVPEP